MNEKQVFNNTDYLTLKRNLSKSGLSIRKIKSTDRNAIFCYILRDFSYNSHVEEFLLSSHLKQWIERNKTLKTDFCELRRWMIDCKIINRSEDGKQVSISPYAKDLISNINGFISA